MLKFEGIYMNAMVYVNEQLAAKICLAIQHFMYR